MVLELRGVGTGEGPAGAKRVTRTGLAVVHENEVVFARPGDEAEAVRLIDDQRATVHVYFPVEIEVRRGAPEQEPEEAARRLLASVVQRLRAIG